MPNPVEGIDQSNGPYVIVSSDTHAGLYVEDYRAYLDAAVHAEFDEWLTTRHEHRAMVEELNGEYVEQWERDNEEGDGDASCDDHFGGISIDERSVKSGVFVVVHVPSQRPIIGRNDLDAGVFALSAFLCVIFDLTDQIKHFAF